MVYQLYKSENTLDFIDSHLPAVCDNNLYWNHVIVMIEQVMTF